MTQAAFYNSTAWRRLSRAFLLSKCYICERCGKPADIAHHKMHITAANITDPDISLNPANLEALCIRFRDADYDITRIDTFEGYKIDLTLYAKRRN